MVMVGERGGNDGDEEIEEAEIVARMGWCW